MGAGGRGGGEGNALHILQEFQGKVIHTEFLTRLGQMRSQGMWRYHRLTEFANASQMHSLQGSRGLRAVANCFLL